MPRSAGDAAPRDYLAHGQWPQGPLQADAPASATYGQVFVQRLNTALAERGNPSMRSIEREAQVGRRTIERVLAGEVLPDFGAIARLEEWLSVDLWPGPELRARSSAETSPVDG